MDFEYSLMTSGPLFPCLFDIDDLQYPSLLHGSPNPGTYIVNRDVHWLFEYGNLTTFRTGSFHSVANVFIFFSSALRNGDDR